MLAELSYHIVQKFCEHLVDYAVKIVLFVQLSKDRYCYQVGIKGNNLKSYANCYSNLCGNFLVWRAQAFPDKLIV